MTSAARVKPKIVPMSYVLDHQVGYVLRQVTQRHTAIFASYMPEDLTPTQWAAIAKLSEIGPCSQNLLGRNTAMDAATVKGVVDRLTRRGLTRIGADPEDGRRLLIALTAEGHALFQHARLQADLISRRTLSPLTGDERRVFMKLLRKMI